MDSASAEYVTCELKVETQSPGWQKTLTKVLKSFQGLSFTIDAERGIARVSGKIDVDKLLLQLVKAGKHADLLWLDSGNHFTNTRTGHGNVGSQLHDNNNIHRNLVPIMHDNAYGYYPPYGLIMEPYNYMEAPSFRSSHYDPYYYSSYYELPARNFPQPPSPEPNPRLESFCNTM